MSSSRKKVIVRRFLPGPLWGYLPPAGLVEEGNSGALSLLDLSGRIQPVPLIDVKYVCFVRDFNTADSAHPERLARKTFAGRPRTEGLWLRMSLRDNDQIEGLAALDLSFADGWAQDRGVHLIPPDVRGNTQRLYVPRSSIDTLEVLAVVTNPSRRKPLVPKPADEEQPNLFAMPLSGTARTQ